MTDETETDERMTDALARVQALRSATDLACLAITPEDADAVLSALVDGQQGDVWRAAVARAHRARRGHRPAAYSPVVRAES